MNSFRILLTSSLLIGMALFAAPKAKPAAASHGVSQAAAIHPVKNFHLYIQDGMWEFADGTKTYVISYVKYNENFDEMPADGIVPPVQVPAPTIRVKVGDEVHVFLHHSGHTHADKNSAIKNVTHTIHFHGLDLVQAMDGVPDLEHSLRQAFDAVSRDEGWATVSSVGSYMAKNNPSFDTRLYGFRKLSDMLRKQAFVEPRESETPNGPLMVRLRPKAAAPARSSRGRGRRPAQEAPLVEADAHPGADADARSDAPADLPPDEGSIRPAAKRVRRKRS